LSEAVRPTDTVARLYGDEFAILLEDLESEADAIVAARRAQIAFEQPFTVSGNSQHLGVSIGIASTGEGVGPDDLLSSADAALSAAKQRGRGRIELHDKRIRERALARLRIERELRESLQSGGLHSVYQPIVSLVEGRIVGFESLLRWEHPDEGTLAPESFIRIAEQSGLIVPIGRDVLDRACDQAVAWRNGDSERPTRVYVNVSPRQLNDDGFLGMLSAALERSGVHPGSVCLEVTETALMDGEGPAVLTEAKRMGVRVVLDDFGTGYSSLSHLSTVPMDEIKIDRSFVERLDTRRGAAAIVAAVVSLARELGVDAVAEGVETEQELEKLRSIGCELAQGFRFARPMNPDAVPGVLARESHGEPLVAAMA
jgi:predicted signal transduction protein with EAL and GGDEF domain